MAATVNYATGRAYFSSLGGRDARELIGVIESAGYTAELPVPPAPDDAPPADPATRALAWRLAVCVPLAAAVIVLAMVPAAQFTGWQWVSLLLAAPVAVWGAWPLHRAAWYGLGHGAATMDTLVSVGVGASFGWSVYALLFGGAGMTGMRMSFAFTFGQASGQTLYLEAAAGVTTAVLAGRYLEARARVRSGSALSALAALGAKTTCRAIGLRTATSWSGAPLRLRMVRNVVAVPTDVAHPVHQLTQRGPRRRGHHVAATTKIVKMRP